MAKTKIAKWAVTAVDTSESADGKARIVGVFGSEEEARAYVRNDMESFVDDSAGMGVVMDEAKSSVHTEDYRYGCEWNVHRLAVETDGTEVSVSVDGEG